MNAITYLNLIEDMDCGKCGYPMWYTQNDYLQCENKDCDEFGIHGTQIRRRLSVMLSQALLKKLITGPALNLRCKTDRNVVRIIAGNEPSPALP